MRRVALAVVATLITLLIGEIGMHFMPPDLWKDPVHFDAPYRCLTYDPILGWKNRALYRHRAFRINALGFRGPDISRHKPPGTIRIVCIGDSRTFGMWSDQTRFRYDSDYASALEALLRSAPPVKTEVVNAGVIGYDSAKGLRQFRTQILKLEPDIIIVSFGFNDHSLAWQGALRCREPRNVIAQALLYGLADLQLFQLGARAYQAIDSFHPAPFAVHWVEPDEYAYNLGRFATIARQYGIHLLLLTQALRPIELGESQSTSPEPPQDPYGLFGAKDLAGLHLIEKTYLDTLYGVARSDDIPIADAAAVFAGHRGEPLFSPYDLVHPTPAGARLIAQTIYAKLLELRWLAAAPAQASR